MTSPYGKLELVEWIDSHSGNGWTRMEDFDEKAALSMTPLHSVGWAIAENDEALCLAQSVGNPSNTEQFNGTITIPKVAIKSRKKLNG